MIKELPLIYREQGSGTRQTMEGFFERNKIEVTKKMELISSGLTQQKDDKTKKIIDLPIKDAILRKFHYENRKRRDDLGLTILQKRPNEEEAAAQRNSNAGNNNDLIK